MARSLNKVMLIGNVGSDPEGRTTQGGTRLAKFSLATNRTWGDGNERTEWHRVTVWGKLADIVEQYVLKGDRLYVEGRIEYSETEDEQGRKRYWTDIQCQELVMLGGQDSVDVDREKARVGGPHPPSLSEPDDDLPF